MKRLLALLAILLISQVGYGQQRWINYSMLSGVKAMLLP